MSRSLKSFLPRRSEDLTKAPPFGGAVLDIAQINWYHKGMNTTNAAKPTIIKKLRRGNQVSTRDFAETVAWRVASIARHYDSVGVRFDKDPEIYPATDVKAIEAQAILRGAESAVIVGASRS